MSFVRRLLGRAESDDRDAVVIAQLRAAGADLSEPRKVDSFLYFPSEAVARHAAERVAEEGRDVAVDTSATDAGWLVRIVETMRVDLSVMHAARRVRGSDEGARRRVRRLGRGGLRSVAVSRPA